MRLRDSARFDSFVGRRQRAGGGGGLAAPGGPPVVWLWGRRRHRQDAPAAGGVRCRRRTRRRRPRTSTCLLPTRARCSRAATRSDLVCLDGLEAVAGDADWNAAHLPPAHPAAGRQRPAAWWRAARRRKPRVHAGRPALAAAGRGGAPAARTRRGRPVRGAAAARRGPWPRAVGGSRDLPGAPPAARHAVAVRACSTGSTWPRWRRSDD